MVVTGKEGGECPVFRDCSTSHPPALISCAYNTFCPALPWGNKGRQSLSSGGGVKEMERGETFWVGGYGKKKTR
jgi:hypothetical protein